MMRLHLFGSVVSACIVVTTFPATSSAALIGRLPATAGGTDYQAYFDDQLNITWAADADINGTGTWDDQNYATSTTIIGGVAGWRLPNMDVDGDGTIIDCAISTKAACTDNEYGHLFYYGANTTFGNGIKVSSPSPFSNLQDNIYWSGTQSATISTSAWIFRFLSDFGDQRTFNVSTDVFSAWLVYDGDVAAVPVPPALWLFGSGLLGLIEVSRRKKEA